jgi:hypothetical protein
MRRRIATALVNRVADVLRARGVKRLAGQGGGYSQPVPPWLLHQDQ